MCDKLIHKYQNWPGPCSSSPQARPEATEATCLTVCGAGLYPFICAAKDSVQDGCGLPEAMSCLL